MYLRSLSDGYLRVHMHDEDAYEITGDNGVNVDLSPDQVRRIVTWYAKTPKWRY
jgi:hypothetical protein